MLFDFEEIIFMGLAADFEDFRSICEEYIGLN